jgi:hypothetical protein
MKIAKSIALLGVFAMTGIILFAFLRGNFSVEGSKLLSMPWGIVSMVDLYTGFILFSLWIIYRESSPWLVVLWVFLMLTLGFFTGSLYVFLALNKSRGDWRKFWLGRHADK